MKLKRSVWLSILAYCAFAYMVFGDIGEPIGFATMWSDRLGTAYWRVLVASSFTIAAVVFLIASRMGLNLPYRILIFAVTGVYMSVLSVGMYVDRLRHEKIDAFNADVFFENSFLRSIQEAPVEWQYFLHAAALKNCTPYAWSYRLMDFYELKPNVAINVLPAEWLERCNIRRDF
ncbi:MAG TPA: hypothetical protein VGO04_12490 [Ensifer sp.]|uniref:hypothetical protein n=1 Tax=Ensifer sp. TaxID=1872086 RepID=UPI002E1174F6|nr:hypothetical protein [Ensifer sp.]